ncbi:MgtC/SapB family protein [Clostridium botulinum]|uniref:MgtC/SapB family protein n=1 Tax=unclassified Clostridium TaxID=2614128 RepID=UPI000500B9DE|nr:MULTISPECIES: MgtC/SapB family protein [unclassified Clostridium]AIY78678.1 mgtC family protein [Clostridium botulinum 202F]KAI3344689.1 MgtC/SapB family protein [Clostridium botulinum]KFX55008.1 magnesium transporter MgtC [Clostridium botulinum]KON12053.1 magnesium transporter MgtC [Clostridium botulinum]MBY6778002.1 MgtC/SapB family protein [Clostridium botulinum]
MNDLMLYLREVNIASIILRLTLATLCAGIIGAERGRKNRPAGFRTHILVCIGATLIMITSQYMRDVLHSTGDITRLGAQVISGIGFLGAGTIIVVGKNQVTGLTTAAGLWACACMGLAIGIGFYEGAIIACVFMLIVVTGLHKLDLYSRTHSRIMDVYTELRDIKGVANFMKADGTKISNIEVKKATTNKDDRIIALTMTLKLSQKCNHSDYTLQLHNIEDVCCVEEII